MTQRQTALRRPEAEARISFAGQLVFWGQLPILLCELLSEQRRLGRTAQNQERTVEKWKAKGH
jgi:hypothetical protein